MLKLTFHDRTFKADDDAHINSKGLVAADLNTVGPMTELSDNISASVADQNRTINSLQRQLAAQQLVIQNGWSANPVPADASTPTETDETQQTMAISLVIFERVGDVDLHLNDAWGREPCTDQEWNDLQELALAELGAVMAASDAVDPDETERFTETYWSVMREVFGPTLEEQEDEEDDDESMGPWAETILEGIVDRNENNNNPDNNNNDDLEEDPI